MASRHIPQMTPARYRNIGNRRPPGLRAAVKNHRDEIDL
jgi:hypothetical protein